MIIGTNAIAKKGNEVNGFYLGLYGMLTGLGVLGLMGTAGHLLLNMVPRSANVLHARLLHTVMDAPLYFFTSTDTGTTINRSVSQLQCVILANTLTDSVKT
jgi:hypothetical protein